MRVTSAFLTVGLVLVAAGAASAQINLNLLADIDMSGTTAATALPVSAVGSNISAIAWDGTNLFVGGYNDTSSNTANVGVVEVANALTSPTLGTPFAPIVAIGADRGYTELAIKNGELAASQDPGGGTGIGVAGYTAATGTFLWSNGSGNGNSSASTSIRTEGVGFDPGFVQGGVGSSPSAGTVATLSFGGGRRIAFNSATGLYVYSNSGGPAPNGGLINSNGAPVGTNTVWRSLAFDPATGNEFARNENAIVKLTRTGDNSYTGSVLDGSSAGQTPFGIASTVDNQSIAFVNSTAYGSFILANDRASGASGQSAATVIRAADPSNAGNFFTLSFSNALPTSFGAYNFSFDPASQTLALSDFGNNQVYIYSVGPAGSSATPEPGTLGLAMCGVVSTLGRPLLRLRGRRRA